MIMAAGNIVQILAPNEQNTSYSLEFRAPQLECNKISGNSTVLVAETTGNSTDLVSDLFNSTIDGGKKYP